MREHHPWQDSFYYHLDAFLMATRSVPDIIQQCFGADKLLLALEMKPAPHPCRPWRTGFPTPGSRLRAEHGRG